MALPWMCQTAQRVWESWLWHYLCTLICMQCTVTQPYICEPRDGSSRFILYSPIHSTADRTCCKSSLPSGKLLTVRTKRYSEANWTIPHSKLQFLLLLPEQIVQLWHCMCQTNICFVTESEYAECSTSTSGAQCAYYNLNSYRYIKKCPLKGCEAASQLQFMNAQLPLPLFLGAVGPF